MAEQRITGWTAHDMAAYLEHGSEACAGARHDKLTRARQGLGLRLSGDPLLAVVRNFALLPSFGDSPTNSYEFAVLLLFHSSYICGVRGTKRIKASLNGCESNCCVLINYVVS